MIRQWVRELLLGARFAVTGGRAGWTRTILTSVGVALGVTVLLLAASVPSAIRSGDIREEARQVASSEEEVPKSETTVSVAYMDTKFRDDRISGLLLQPDGDPTKSARPPGIDRVPGPGEMFVSPALRSLLDSADGKKLLVERFEGAKVVGTVENEGLHGPGELLFYLGTDDMGASDDRSERIEAFGGAGELGDGLPPVLLLLVVVMMVVLLAPIAVFVATAVRFGGESRDRRLAALRLVGADNAMTRRIAAGESLVGALFGLLLGGWFFLLGRSFAGDVQLFNVGAFPSDVTPTPGLAVLILLLVPSCAVLVTLFALRKVVISPLGVAREGADRGRRLWWRLVLLGAGAGMLALIGPGVDEGGDAHVWALAFSMILTLVGTTTLLPWVVERAVGKLSGGPLSWQLATRRLQLNSGLAARAVSGVTMAVAGAIALQMMYGAVEAQDRSIVEENPNRAQISVTADIDRASEMEKLTSKFEQVEGINEVTGYVSGIAVHEDTKLDEEEGYREAQSVVIAECATLRQLINADSCREGDAYFVPSEYSEEERTPKPGDRYDLNADMEEAKSQDPRWLTMPAGTREVTSLDQPIGHTEAGGIFLTPSLVESGDMQDVWAELLIRTDKSDPDVVEHARNVSGITDLDTRVTEMTDSINSDEFTTVRNGLFLGALIIMLLIASSMIVSTLEQLRERKRQLSVLVAFGTRRSTLGASVLWQTAIPLVLGLTLAAVGGVGLGLLLLRMVGEPVADWFAVLPLLGVGLGMIVLVTLASMPSLWRMMRPDGLRTE